mmetsp:Transcript_27070/g.45107  ORF Transcript_27070/g.45107 Transcript_27070/m.45107 type:complete len:353 (+) Transcript_27070:174-1232(+)|eukprot:CAMPEP_0119016766 /NCGR_PEP_ID=MMETSP1176-20130426/14362_1 /TAXON_ID=265551 /ORGANISM="Synedropsis recta cf, Strain CCMP1620" /LENGTH=352 /DNA_ID=CAMNT_0006970293 /DNA_START=159 /DNA_END=1217 /DNA_ORIENTATION=+
MAQASSSRFDVSYIPEGLHARRLEQHSVHYNPGTRLWVATIARPERAECTGKKTVSFKFKGEREAKKFAHAYSPPKIVAVTSACQVCSSSFNNRMRPCSCRNCGACICEKCSARWGIRMLPKTYVPQQSTTVRVCQSCDWLSNAFCISLLHGKLRDAIKIFETGNVNLRTTFASINGEAMFPVHCAVMGGNLRLLHWLVETRACPITVRRDPRTGRMLSVQTSGQRSLIDLAMTGKPKLDILKYLIIDQKMSLLDTNNPKLAPRTLEALLRAGITLHDTPGVITDEAPHFVEAFSEESVTTIDDACNLCYEQPMDCVLTPCGHQVCCADCGTKVTTCPVCKVNCSVLRVFRQ